MDFEKTTTITLKVIPYRDNSKILRVLTEDDGIISVMVSGISKKKMYLNQVCSLFTISEMVLKKRKTDLYFLKDASVLDNNLHLREKLSYLKEAGSMIVAIMNSHFFQKKSKNIFILLKTYLKKISINPEAVSLSFLLKILLNEGLINPKESCNRCPSPALFFDRGEPLCEAHATSFSHKFTIDEYKTLLVLSLSRSFSIFKDLEITSALKEKTKIFFLDLVK